ncbi:MAG TPA: serine hydroxymethyltransferase [Candidatus Brocadiia bacterium]|nr:serine hydroxymethyltransferase [Candidatus Brocadiia bacterium]
MLENRRRECLSSSDPEIWQLTRAEAERQRTHIELIASENYSSPNVRQVMASELTDKYAEGYPRHRWYEGCQVADSVESLAISRAKKLFGAEHANVQPHAGSQANMAVYFSFLKPGDKILSMDLRHGGHLTHGHSHNFSGLLFQICHYGVNRETEQIDYDELRDIARDFRPNIIVAGASSYPRTLRFDRFRAIADEVGARLMVDIAHIAGLVAAGVHPDPVCVADYVTSTTHKTLRGPRGGFILCKSEYGSAIDKTIFPGMQGGPLMHIIAAKAVAFREAMEPEFKIYAEQIVRNAKVLCESLADKGAKIVSGGTDNHLFLIDCLPLGISGGQAAAALDRANITANKNVIPFDTRPPHDPSGVRIGTPAITTRGMTEPEMILLSDLIWEVMTNSDDEATIARVKSQVLEMCEAFPVPG